MVRSRLTRGDGATTGSPAPLPSRVGTSSGPTQVLKARNKDGEGKVMRIRVSVPRGAEYHSRVNRLCKPLNNDEWPLT